MPFRLEARGQHSMLWSWLSPVIAIVATLIVSTALFAAMGKPAGDALYTFVVAPISSLNGLAELGVKAAPLVLIGVGLAIGFRANVWNIGAEGQLILGAIVGGGIGLAAGDREGFWILPAMIEAYTELYRRGVAHSAEAWSGDRLVGGLYGVSLGACFFGESMFALEPDASKLAFVALVEQLERWGIPIVDCQIYTPHLARFGAREWPREDFLDALRAALERPTRLGPWRYPIRFRASLVRGGPADLHSEVQAAPGCRLTMATSAVPDPDGRTRLTERCTVTAPWFLIGYLTRQAHDAHARTFALLPGELEGSG